MQYWLFLAQHCDVLTLQSPLKTRRHNKYYIFRKNNGINQMQKESIGHCSTFEVI